MARIGASGTGGGGVQGIPPTTITAIALWGDTTANTLTNSLVLVDMNGYVYGAGFLSNDGIPLTETLTIAANKQLIAASYYNIFGDIILYGTFMVI